PELVRAAKEEYDAAEAHMRERLHCLTAKPMPAACAINVHYLFYVVRRLPPKLVFAQIALGFALTAADPRFVGVDFVAPEDDPVSLRDFHLHMRMFQYFKQRDPKVKLSLHAGELALGLVPPADLGFHITETVRVAGAERIGHGYGIPYETDAAALLREMAAKRIAVEINLTSNDITPGVKGADHPMAMYRAAGVPVTLSADDEGVFRIDLTHEYVRAMTEQKLNYLTLKDIARNGIEYSFLPGASLWPNGGYKTITSACGRSAAGSTPSGTCAAFLATSEKARMQWQLEQAFADYETWVLSTPFAR
ncbi:MAG: adenosine deaminase, partial [Alphaproteobacteria bacterium]|nr:adenosine deaminase [Alphaproteobacteria bacterium]